MGKQVLLHGGPLNGKWMMLDDNVNHFHIEEFTPPSQAQYRGELPAEPETRIGTYSQVSGIENRQNFEWDGWVKH